MTSRRQLHIEQRNTYLVNAADFIRLAQEARQRMIDSTLPSMTDSYDIELLVNLAQVNIAMAHALDASWSNPSWWRKS